MREFIFMMPFMHELHANLLLVRKYLSSRLKVQFNLNECIVRIRDEKIIVISLRKVNLYQKNFANVHGVDVANLMQS